ncbi:MAG: sulfite exporter TauE/SafE family protein [Magnetococcales bacterium]|nr:sulfite exporter TauE/SafE family protein [Magnetococcales bacterium]
MSATPIDLWLTFVTALLASGHCIGMCGGMVAALSFARDDHSRLPARSIDLMMRHFFYSCGRLSTYLVLGGLSGWLGSLVPTLGRSPTFMALPLILAGGTMILMGLETWGIPVPGFSWARGWHERLLGKKNIHSTWKKPAALGLLTGLLPCGLHWAFQAKAFATGSITGGLSILLAFGLGTLPALLGLGWIITLMGPKIRQVLQRAAALLVVIMGVMAVIHGWHKAGLWE